MRERAQKSLDMLGIGEEVPVITEDDVEQAKPEPNLFFAAAKKLKMDLEHCVVVGDSVWDLLAAQRAHALGIGLLAGGYGRTNWREQAPTASIAILKIGWSI